MHGSGCDLSFEPSRKTQKPRTLCGAGTPVLIRVCAGVLVRKLALRLPRAKLDRQTGIHRRSQWSAQASWGDHLILEQVVLVLVLEVDDRDARLLVHLVGRLRGKRMVRVSDFALCMVGL